MTREWRSSFGWHNSGDVVFMVLFYDDSFVFCVVILLCGPLLVNVSILQPKSNSAIHYAECGLIIAIPGIQDVQPQSDNSAK